MTYEKVLRQAYKKAELHHKEIEAVKYLLIELSQQTPAEFFLNLKEEMDETLHALFLSKLDDYLLHDIPVQHILGYAYFVGRKFMVSPAVLIPRGETEMLVEEVLIKYDTYFQDQKVSVIDLGTGSGCIGITLSLEEKNMDVTISDISLDALEVAKRNQEILGSHTHIIHSDLFSSIDQTFDIIISNPPYIPEDEDVDQMVKKEPSVALYGGKEGITFYELIIKHAKDHIKPKSIIGFEHGFQQKEMINDIARKYFKDAKIENIKDLSGKDRFTFIFIGF